MSHEKTRVDIPKAPIRRLLIKGMIVILIVAAFGRNLIPNIYLIWTILCIAAVALSILTYYLYHLEKDRLGKILSLAIANLCAILVLMDVLTLY